MARPDDVGSGMETPLGLLSKRRSVGGRRLQIPGPNPGQGGEELYRGSQLEDPRAPVQDPEDPDPDVGTPGEIPQNAPVDPNLEKQPQLPGLFQSARRRRGGPRVA